MNDTRRVQEGDTVYPEIGFLFDNPALLQESEDSGKFGYKYHGDLSAKGVDNQGDLLDTSLDKGCHGVHSLAIEGNGIVPLVQISPCMDTLSTIRRISTAGMSWFKSRGSYTLPS